MKKLIPVILFLLGIFLQPYGASAQAGWQWGLSNSSSFVGVTEAAQITTDVSGNAFIAGTMVFGDSIQIGAYTVRGNGSSYWVKVDSSGSPQWVVSTSISTVEQIAICTDHSGNLYVTGQYSGNDSLKIDTVVVQHSVSNTTNFIAKISPGGHALWVRNIANSYITAFFSGGIAADPEGNVYVTGSYNVPVDTVDTIAITNTTSTGYLSDVFVAKYNAAGRTLWARSFGGVLNERSNALSISGHGNIYVICESYSPTVFIAGDTISDSPSTMGFVLVKFDELGNYRWARPSGGQVRAFDVAGLDDDGCYVAGKYDDLIVYGTDTISYPGGSQQSILLRYDSTGSVLWGRGISGDVNSQSYKVAADTCGNAWVCGTVRGRMHCAGTTIDTPLVCSDPLYITAYSKCGDYIAGTGHIIASGADDLCGLALDGRGNLYTGGDYGHAALVFGPDTLHDPGTLHEYLLLVKYRTGPMPCADTPCHPVPTLQATQVPGKTGSFIFYPNPASDEVFLVTDLPQGGVLTLHDVYGRVVRTFKVNSLQATIYIGDLAPGAYICELRDADHTEYGRLAVIR